MMTEPVWDTTGVNPYSPTPVAQVTGSGEGTVTIPTDAVRAATDILDAYLDSPRPTGQPRHGKILTILGDWGTGKTHLAVALRQRARRRADPTISTVYVDAPAGRFTDLYYRLITLLDWNDLNELLRDYYADVVADELSKVPHASPISDRLRAYEIDPVDVVQDLGLMDSVLLQRLQRQLIDITQNNDLGTAVTLLLDPELVDAIRSWLGGSRPGELLQERGILRTIDQDDEALTAILAIARLYGHRGHRFILIVDEFDRLLGEIQRRQQEEDLTGDPIGAFKRTLEQVEAAGAFVIVAGATDMKRAIGESVLQRMGHMIHIPALSTSQVRDFMRQSHQLVRHDDRLDPFTDDSIDFLVRLNDGVARKIIELCHHLYRRAQDSGAPVTVEMVREVAREHVSVASTADVRREAHRALHHAGIRFNRGHDRDASGEPLVDFWVADVDGERRCAILVSSSVMTAADVQSASRRIRTAHEESEDLAIVFVVVGYLSPDVAPELERLLDRDPIEYARHSFAEDLNSTVSEILTRFTGTLDPLEAIRSRVDRITRRQASTQGLVEQLAHHLITSTETVDRQLTAIRRELAGTARGSREADTAATGGSTAVDSTLSQTEELFTGALDEVTKLDRLERILARAFDPDGSHSAEVQAARTAVQFRLRQYDGFIPLGAAVFLRQLITTFHAAFLDWYHASDVWSAGRLSATDRARLDQLCYSYEAIYQHIPLYQLKKLVESTTYHPDLDENVESLAWPTIHLDDLRRAFGDLAVKVRTAVHGWGAEQETLLNR